jgi:hypothetical protein
MYCTYISEGNQFVLISMPNKTSVLSLEMNRNYLDVFGGQLQVSFPITTCVRNWYLITKMPRSTRTTHQQRRQQIDRKGMVTTCKVVNLVRTH